MEKIDGMKHKIIAQIAICFFIISCVSKKDENVKEQKDINTIKNRVLVEDTLTVTDKEKVHNLTKDTLNKTLKQRLKGRFYTGLPCSLEELKDYYCPGWALVDNDCNKTLSLSPVHKIEGIPSYVMLQEYNDKNDSLIVNIIEVLDLTKISLLKDDRKYLYYHFCYKEGINDTSIIAVAKYEEGKPFLTTIYKAWQVDCETEKIIEISTESITVENVGYDV